jgi:hypothetical protein
MEEEIFDEEKVQKGGIAKAMVEIEQNVQSLDVILQQLEKKISPAMRPAEPTPSDSRDHDHAHTVERPSEDAPIAHNLQMYAKNIKGLYARVHRLQMYLDI